ncbi:hypothetical protein G6L37_05815 [Agrobacterium rubi]|nr:hypothetical protein [Agrobacterium rubi]NTF24876.1 hypothetical protein [Agrobacterium rubi]
MTVYPMLTYNPDRPENDRELMLGYVRQAMASAVREAYDKGLNDGRKWIGNRAGNPYHGREVTEELGTPLFEFVKRFASARMLKGGIEDLTTFDDISEAMDAAEVPDEKNEKRLTLLERVEELAYMLEEEQGHVEELRCEGKAIAAEFEGDLWKSTRRILDRLKFDWSGVDSEGVTATDAEDFIVDAITHLERKARPLSSGKRFLRDDAVEEALS